MPMRIGRRKLLHGIMIHEPPEGRHVEFYFKTSLFFSVTIIQACRALQHSQVLRLSFSFIEHFIETAI